MYQSHILTVPVKCTVRNAFTHIWFSRNIGILNTHVGFNFVVLGNLCTTVCVMAMSCSACCANPLH